MTVTDDRAEIAEIDETIADLYKRRLPAYGRINRAEQRYRDRILTINDIMVLLSTLPPEKPVFATGGAKLGWPHAYRMSHGENMLAIAPHPTDDNDTWTAARALEELKNAVGWTFEHAKGYQYTMNGSSKVWISPHDQLGVGVFAVREHSKHIELVTRKEP